MLDKLIRNAIIYKSTTLDKGADGMPSQSHGWFTGFQQLSSVR